MCLNQTCKHLSSQFPYFSGALSKIILDLPIFLHLEASFNSDIEFVTDFSKIQKMDVACKNALLKTKHLINMVNQKHRFSAKICMCNCFPVLGNYKKNP